MAILHEELCIMYTLLFCCYYLSKLKNSTSINTLARSLFLDRHGMDAYFNSISLEKRSLLSLPHVFSTRNESSGDESCE